MAEVPLVVPVVVPATPDAPSVASIADRAEDGSLLISVESIVGSLYMSDVDVGSLPPIADSVPEASAEDRASLKLAEVALVLAPPVAADDELEF
ncbi:MAG TPA: hypothetical protein VEF89_08215 [Solirubrobacteraceae bacterium]|nr:hypothetical protein [Solirubrobacteraceae bacterium]